MSLNRYDGQNRSREHTVAEVLLGVLELPPSGRFLVADDTHGFVRQGLQSDDTQIHQYWRAATDEHGAEAWPPPGPFDGATLRISKDKTAFEMNLHALASVLRKGAFLWIYGANDEGIKSASKKLSPLFTDVHTVDTRRHCRVLRALRSDDTDTLRSTLSDWAMDTELLHPTGAIMHRTYPGIFAKGRLDAGTALLLDAIGQPNPGAHILDYACGAGVIAGELYRRQPDVQLTMMDADAVAVFAAQENVPTAHAQIMSDPMAIDAQPPFDMIVSNPPIHEGKERDYRVVRRLIESAARNLRKGCPLWMVVQKQVPVTDALGTHLASASCVSTDGRFNVWRAIRP